jgi:glucose-6-phosphate 1-dehydrogenase
VENVQIIFQESRGRGGHFDSNGVVRDVMQNHCLQILAYFAMEPPVSLCSADVSSEKTKLLRCIEPVRVEDTVYGQYVESELGPSYRDDKTVADDSTTATFCTCALKIKNRRWDGVPFIIKAGFALNEDLVEIRMSKL